MTPIEKATALVYDYNQLLRQMGFKVTDGWRQFQKAAKQCALIAVDTRLEDNLLPGYEYWKEVKEEIEKL